MNSPAFIYPSRHEALAEAERILSERLSQLLSQGWTIHSDTMSVYPMGTTTWPVVQVDLTREGILKRLYINECEYIVSNRFRVIEGNAPKPVDEYNIENPLDNSLVNVEKGEWIAFEYKEENVR